MKRRSFMAATTALASSTSMAQSPSPGMIELTWFYLRNGADMQRTRMTEWLVTKVTSALQRAGAGPIGLFSPVLGGPAPFILLMAGYESWKAIEDVHNRLDQDEAFQKDYGEFYARPGLPFTRGEVQLLTAFKGFPKIEVPPQDRQKPARVFELRTYESNTPVTLRKKIKMFEDGEIDIFRKTGLTPVFFGRMVAGPRLPNLTYLLAFDNLAAREANWRQFGTSPEWQKLSATPGLSDAEVVSNISNMILAPLNGSPIR